MSDSLQSHGQQHTRLPCPSLTTGVCSELMSTESVMSSNYLILCRPLLLLPPRLSQHQGRFKWVSSSHQVAKVLELQLQHKCFQENSGWFPLGLTDLFFLIIYFLLKDNCFTEFKRVDWFDLLVVQGTLKSLLQNHNSKASVLQLSAIFMVQFSHPYMITGKTCSFD